MNRCWKKHSSNSGVRSVLGKIFFLVRTGTAAGVDILRPFEPLVDDVHFLLYRYASIITHVRQLKKAQFKLRCSIGAMTIFYFF